MNSLLEQAKEAELKYRNKIIELQKQLQFENLRASEYETKFKQAVMENSTKKGDQQLLEKLNQKQSEIFTLRKQLLDANRKINDSNNQEQVEEIMRQNIEMRKVVQQLKNAAIAAIMEKDMQIEQLKKNIHQLDMVAHISQLQQKNHQLEQLLKARTYQYEQELRKVNQKLSNERNGYSERLTKLQRQFSHQQNQKQKLIQKAQSLEGNVENLQKVVEKYEQRLSQIEHLRSNQKISSSKNQYELERRIQSLLDDIKVMEKNQQNFAQTALNLNRTIQDLNKKIEVLNEQKQQLDRKLKIKNRKNNTKESSKSIYQSFEGFSQKADVFASFARRQHKDPVKESFVGDAIKLSDIKQIEIEQIQNFSDYIHDVKDPTKSRKNSSNIEQKTNVSSQNQNQKQIQQNQSTIKINTAKIHELEQKIQNLLNQIENYNTMINNVTKELQKQRQDKLGLKQKHTTAQSQFKVEKEGLRLHIYKLQNALLIQKLQNAERIESNKQIRQYEKKVYEQQIQKLKNEIEASKKKKGFFNK